MDIEKPIYFIGSRYVSKREYVKWAASVSGLSEKEILTDLEIWEKNLD